MFGRMRRYLSCYPKFIGSPNSRCIASRCNPYKDECIPKEKPILFAPNKCFGNYLIKRPNRPVKLWNSRLEREESTKKLKAIIFVVVSLLIAFLVFSYFFLNSMRHNFLDKAYG